MKTKIIEMVKSFFKLPPTPYTLLHLFLIPCVLITNAYAGVDATKHNLSTSGPGPIRSDVETQVCAFCHTPHASVTVPLWNHTMSQASYAVPSSSMTDWSTMLSNPQNPPDGDSRLCLSCHDGTVAIGSVVNLGGAPATISVQDYSGTGRLTPEGKLAPKPESETQPWMVMGTDLSGHHPVSIEVNQKLVDDKGNQCNRNEVSFAVLYDPQPPIRLKPTENRYGGDTRGLGVQCSSCHDAHDDTNGYFLRVPYGGDPWDITSYPLCTKCHLLCP